MKTLHLLCLSVFGFGFSAAPAQEIIPKLRVERKATFPHDRQAFTQGLLVFEGKLFESTGLYGRSSLRRVDLQTGTVEKKIDLPREYFAEGLARVDRTLIQITWKEGKAFVWNLDTFEQTNEFTYTGEGWGLAFDGKALLMTDGSNRVTLRNPQTFEPQRTLTVLEAGQPLMRLNELEFMSGRLYANVWMEDRLVRIDPGTGRVTATISAAGLLEQADRNGADVLNGIAQDDATGKIYLTGKLWPKLFEVTLVPEVPLK